MQQALSTAGTSGIGIQGQYRVELALGSSFHQFETAHYAAPAVFRQSVHKATLKLSHTSLLQQPHAAIDEPFSNARLRRNPSACCWILNRRHASY